jgi:tRNA(Ile2) C34 agmatinyltransferase TiaS
MLIKRLKNAKFEPLFRFNSEGEFITSDEKLIETLAKKFKYEVIEEVKEENVCKNCKDTFESKGKLLAHYRKCKVKEVV